MADNEQIKCLVLPVSGPAVVVPNSSVAEIITQQEVTKYPETPDWLLGTGRWRGTDIPLIAYDYMVGEREEAPAPDGRFVVLFGLEGEGTPGFYAVRIERLPRTETLDRERLRSASDGLAHDSQFVAARAELGDDRECLIPALDAIGHELAQYGVHSTGT